MNNSKRFLDILIVFLLTVLVFNLFFSSKNQNTKDTLDIAFQYSKYTIPASVNILVKNYTDSPIGIDTCNDLNILKSGEKMDFGKDFCENVLVGSGQTVTISYEKKYKSFDDIGKYTLEALVDGKKFLDQFELEHRGIIKKTFIGLIYAPIFNLVIFLIKIFNGSFGWAIITITILLKLLLYYPQQKMIISQKRMQEIQPKIEALKVQYKGDQAKLGQELMALYSKEKINPFGSLGFLFIQLPILLVVYNIIRYIQTPVNEYYLYGFSGNFSVANINFNFYGLDLLSNGGIQGIILAIAVAGLQFLQIKISLPKKRDSASNTQGHNKVVLEKKENGKDYSKVGPNPEMMNKIMLYLMPIMVLYFTYSLFAALGLYWGISTLFMLIQNLIVNKIFKK